MQEAPLSSLLRRFGADGRTVQGYTPAFQSRVASGWQEITFTSF